MILASPLYSQVSVRILPVIIFFFFDAEETLIQQWSPLLKETLSQFLLNGIK